jgi:membrane protease YdiL (CAAX protease family)
MTDQEMTDQIPGPDSLDATVPPPRPTRRRSVLFKVFVGPQGVRAGWKILVFLLIFGAVAFCLRPLAKLLPKVDPKSPIPAGVAFVREFLVMLAVLTATGLMAKLIDRKPWGYFGMPVRNALRSSFWIGAAIGLGALALQLEIMHVCGWFDFGTVQLHGAAIVKYGLIWGFMFLWVGVTEESLLRGYVQRVTTDGLSMLPKNWSFWISALLFSILFAASHLANPGENRFGTIMVFIDGMAMCFSLWRTGDLWFAIGNHAAWDWGQTFLFGTANSGIHGQHALMNPSFHGPTLLAGGTDGPEGSVLVLLSEALFVILVALIYRRRKFSLTLDNRGAIDTKIRRGIDQLDRGEGIPEDRLDAYLADLKAKPE